MHKYIATSLVELVDKPKYKYVLEIGCGTGLLTERLKEKIEYETLYLNDIAEFDQVNLLGDIDYIELPKKCNLIISSSMLHWSENLEKLIKKIHKNLRQNGEFIFSLFVEGNLEETKQFNQNIHYRTFDEILDILSKRFNVKLSYSETIEKRFPSALDALREFKNLGIPGTGTHNIKDIRSFQEIKLTYQTAYFVAKKEKHFSIKKIALRPLSALRAKMNKSQQLRHAQKTSCGVL
ncbi:MAG: methyltransferase domain-containing protein [Fusobacteria bacterium]|nr:methyltransferase domain-containing protein [Fusobacteriota bacterium]